MMSAMSDVNCWYVVVNPVSGGGRARRYWPRPRMALDRMRVPYRSTESTAAGVTSELVVGALQDGHRHFLALSGDGSFHQLIDGLMTQQRVPLTGLICGVAPVGSGNDWARAFGVPTDPAQLAAVMSDCRSRYVDLGFATCTEPGGNGELTVAFHNGAGAGLDAAVVRRIPASGPRAIAYLVGLARAMRGFAAPHFEVRAGGQFFAGSCVAVIAANGPTCGGGMRLAPAARHDDGFLDVILFDRIGLWRAATLVPGLYNGRAVRDRAVRTIRCHEALITSDPPCDVEADGQLIGRTPLSVRIQPASLQVLDCRGNR
jgi:diacylglycerol kinase family enzyme